MDYKIVGQVTIMEKNEVVILSERLAALYELRLSEKSLDLAQEERDRLLGRITQKEIETNKLLEQWWHDKYSKYNWEGQEKCKWEIDFKSRNVYMKKENNY
jgi:CXXX repeat modification system protein